MHNLMHPWVRDFKLPREFSLRNASSVPSTDDDIAFFGGKTGVRRRGQSIQFFEEMRNGIGH